MSGDRLDIVEGDSHRQPSSSAGGDRVYLRVLFVCCNVYTRIYVKRSAAGVVARCPRCGRAQPMPIDGTMHF